MMDVTYRIWVAITYKSLDQITDKSVITFILIQLLPQFVDQTRGHVGLQMLLLGMCFLISATTVNISYALLFYHFKQRMLGNLRFTKWLNKLTGIVFCAMAYKVITSRQ